MFTENYGIIQESMLRGTTPPQDRGGKMAEKDLSTKDRATRGKRLLLYGMFALVIVTVVTLFLTSYLWLAPWGPAGASAAVRLTVVVGAVAIVACVIVWFVYTKLILKE
jgi:hypothetical protein